MFDKLLKMQFPVPVFFKSTTQSTNLDASAMLTAGQTPPFMILSGVQTNGYGQRGARWEGNALGNLYLSFALKVSPGIEQKLSIMSQHMAMKICEILKKKLAIEAKTKWPNDIFIGDKKAGGLLLEVVRCGNKARAAIIGIGVNILHSPELVERMYAATCLQDNTEITCEFDDIVASIIRCIIGCVKEIKHVSGDDIAERWKVFDFMYGRRIRVVLPDGDVDGQHGGITTTGELIIENSNGETVHLKQGCAKIYLQS